MTKPKRVALYARVSTDGQTVSNQLEELREVAERHGWEVVQEFTDKGISGAKGREDRPQFNAMWKGIIRKDFDLIATWSIDRLGRSLLDLLHFLKDVHPKGLGLYFHKQGLDTTTPSGKMQFQLLGAFAEYERAMIQERVRAGLQRAKREGKRLGRPMVNGEKEAEV